MFETLILIILLGLVVRSLLPQLRSKAAQRPFPVSVYPGRLPFRKRKGSR